MDRPRMVDMYVANNIMMITEKNFIRNLNIINGVRKIKGGNEIIKELTTIVKGVSPSSCISIVNEKVIIFD